jgi:hypothetical protein
LAGHARSAILAIAQFESDTLSLCLLTSREAIEISAQIYLAKNRYYKAIERAGTGITDLEEIDRVISEVFEAGKVFRTP